MSLPLSYNLRNLRIRWRMTVATVLGIALVVAVFVMVMALARGLKSTLISTGDERNLLIIRQGSTAESSSQITRDQMRIMKYLDGIQRNQSGDPMISPEIIVLIYLDRADGHGGANVLVRGMGALGPALRPDCRIVEGRMFQPGLGECIVSSKIAQRFAHCQLGQTFRSGRTAWRVAGVFDAARTAYESEIWVDADEAREVYRRNFYGSALLRPADESAARALKERMEKDKNLEVRVLRETEYYREQTQMAGPIQFMGGFLATIMSIGAAFSAMNTMYAAVGARTREIGTLRVLGFRRRSIYASVMIESVLLALVGGALGCLLALPIHGLTTGTFGWNTFAEVAFEFRITGELIAKGLIFALVMGVIGGLLPARMAARMQILDALRSV